MEFETVVRRRRMVRTCYHGGVVQDDAAGQLRRLAEELASGA